MAKKKIKRRRKFDRETLFPNKIIPEYIRGKKELEKAIPCRFCQMSYLDSIIEELDKLIAQKEMRVAIVDDCGNDLSKIYNYLADLQGNGKGI